MDDACYDVLSTLGLSNVQLFTIRDLESGDKELVGAKQDRSRIEYYFTCTPSLLLFVLDKLPGADIVTYLDADLFFFDNPALVYDEIADQSIAIIEHRFSPNLKSHEVYGIYNVGWVSIRRDENGLSCLQWWRERCIEWCHDWVDNGRYADQKYLDEWPKRFHGVVVLNHKGANLAPWNLANYEICVRGNAVLVDDQPLVFFHFHGLKQVRTWLYDSDLAGYYLRGSRLLRRTIYTPYIRALLEAGDQIAPLLRPASGSKTGDRSLQETTSRPASEPPLRTRMGRRPRDVLRGIVNRSYFLVLKNVVI
jgi:hypothetical protein